MTIVAQILAEMTDAQLQKIGITSFGHRHFILKRVQALNAGPKVEVSPSASTGSMVNSNWVQGGSSSRMDTQRSSTDGHIRTAEEPGRTLFSKPAIPRLHHPTPRIHESQVTIGRKIGSGSVGYVFEGKYEQHPVAIEKHKTDGSTMDHKALAEFEIEVGKMTAVNHPCIVRCYGMLDPSPGIVMELVQGGSLFQIIHGERGESYDQYKHRLPWAVRLRYLLDAMYGLRAVHNANLIHGDFKTLNLLVERDQRVKASIAFFCSFLSFSASSRAPIRCFLGDFGMPVKRDSCFMTTIGVCLGAGGGLWLIQGSRCLVGASGDKNYHGDATVYGS